MKIIEVTLRNSGGKIVVGGKRSTISDIIGSKREGRFV